MKNFIRLLATKLSSSLTCLHLCRCFVINGMKFIVITCVEMLRERHMQASRIVCSPLLRGVVKCCPLANAFTIAERRQRDAHNETW
jgi:hypothetical protein